MPRNCDLNDLALFGAIAMRYDLEIFQIVALLPAVAYRTHGEVMLWVSCSARFVQGRRYARGLR